MSINKNFILQEVIDDLINPEKSLVGPLMKLTYFGRLTKNEELTTFTTNEINGYKNKDSKIPNYRKGIGSLMVQVQAYMDTRILEVPASMLKAPFNSAFKHIEVREGISAIEKMGREMNGKSKNQFFRQIPMELFSVIQPAVSKLYKSDVPLDVIGAKIIGNGNIIVEIPNSIRTSLLEFVMQIADKFGYDIEVDGFNKGKNNNQTINNIMNTTINTSGDGNVINTGDNSTLTSTIKIKKGDKDKLVSELKKLGIEQEDVDGLVSIVEKEQPDDKNKLGEKTNNWILKILGKGLKGVGKIATGISANLLTTMIQGYHGIE